MMKAADEYAKREYGSFENQLMAVKDFEAGWKAGASAEDGMAAKLEQWIDMTVNCAGVPQNPDSLPQMLLYEMRAALSRIRTTGK
jgi:hypothetical protein